MISKQDLEALAQKFLTQINDVADIDGLMQNKVAALGKKGEISGLMKSLGKMSPEDRKIFGEYFNQIKTQLLDAISQKEVILKQIALSEKMKDEALDITLPPRPQAKGYKHPISQVTKEVIDILSKIGFCFKTGPEIETEDLNFTYLNIPEDHPARQMHDTFYFDQETPDGGRYLLRTHTSPVQIRTMLSQQPPLRILTAGKTFRCDSDMTHTPMFHQLEGLVLDKDINMAHLRGTLEYFCKEFFETENITLRFRPSFFPFTEPSIEVDILCDRTDGQIKIGTGSDWLEILGAGMVHPNVLKNCHYNLEDVQGFAFGMGIDRLAMLKYGMADLRAFFEGDIHWLKHYGFSLFGNNN